MNKLNVKLPVNCWMDNKGFVLPKSPMIRNTKEVVDWIKNNSDPKFCRMFTSDKFRDSLYHEDDPWITIGISHSWQGYVYAFVYSESDEKFERFSKDNPYVVIFDNDIEGFKKYLGWVSTIGPKFTKQLKKPA